MPPHIVRGQGSAAKPRGPLIASYLRRRVIIIQAKQRVRALATPPAALCDERPRDRAAEKRDELAPSHVLSSSRGSHPTTSLRKQCCASQHFGPPDPFYPQLRTLVGAADTAAILRREPSHRSRTLRMHGDCRNLDLHVAREAGDLDSCTGGRRAFEERGIDLVHPSELV